MMTHRLPITTLAVFAGMMVTALPGAAQTVDFGDDSSIWAMDGECDDPRFIGEGMSADPLEADMFADASDCAAAFDAGTVTLDPAMADARPPAGQPTKPGATTAPITGALDFGDDTSPWAKDGECDDPRFEGEGMAPSPQDSDMFADATDCLALFDAGSIRLIGGTQETVAAPAGAIDFGDDSGQWTSNGECDDPRFEGEGMASVLLDEDLFADATDCRTLYEAGRIAFAGDAAASSAIGAAVDFGADTGQWINDGECDDPRFEGEGMADVLVEDDLFADATDCRALYEAGMIAFIGEAATPDQIDFGIDSGKWAGDGECDDPRFTGEGMAAAPLDAFRRLDATDCRTLYEAGQLSYLGE